MCGSLLSTVESVALHLKSQLCKPHRLPAISVAKACPSRFTRSSLPLVTDPGWRQPCRSSSQQLQGRAGAGRVGGTERRECCSTPHCLSSPSAANTSLHASHCCFPRHPSFHAVKRKSILKLKLHSFRRALFTASKHPPHGHKTIMLWRSTERSSTDSRF